MHIRCTKEELAQAIADSKSLKEVLHRLPQLRSWVTLKNHVAYYELDTSNLLGQGWNRGNYDYDKFEAGKVVSSALALPALIHKRGHRCERCNQTHWLSQLIPLEVHHIDGDKLNNQEDNLALLCPNCHALTDNYRGRNRGKKTYISDDEFVEALRESKNIRQALLKLGLTAKGANYSRARHLIDLYKIEF